MSTAIEEYKKSVREEGRQEGREEGRQEGREEGRQKGREEGRQEGREEGRQEGAQESRNEIVTNMLMDHCTIATIEKYTQLPQEQILQIAKANNISLP